jgi:2-furoyl-CoA dehydrogenase FAD binding subunit
VQPTARVAFREVARRHGDFAIVAVAACVEDGDMVRIGIGGVADRPAAWRGRIKSAAAAAYIFESLAWDLEGYDDQHASARLRCDLLRRVGPTVVEEALRCAA